MPRLIEISLLHRGVHAVAELAEEAAPQTCEAVWGALPLEGPAGHAKRAHDEVWTLAPGFPAEVLGLENATIYPMPRDVMYFQFSRERSLEIFNGLKNIMPFSEEVGLAVSHQGFVGLSIFYGRNNLLFNHLGPTPGSVFATITDGFEEMAHACQDVWYGGARRERLQFDRLEP